ncbi:MAG: hypothetical protein K5863_09050 [Nitratireductor sp.]|nr:hypothetical protein [Nitratireductor sp.]MCV0350211.1 hypothetical protein [Nitratireductor sp.]
MTTALVLGGVYAHVLARILMREPLQLVLAIVLAGIVTVGALEVPH